MSNSEEEIQLTDKLVNGRKLWLQCFDSVLAKESNIRMFAQAIQTKIEVDPLGVWQQDVKPLLPKQGENENMGLQEISIQLIPKQNTEEG